MASQVLSGAANASYTNNTGQNVRLIINYMSNVTSMTWAGVNVTASATTIGKDIQNITGELRQAVPGSIVESIRYTAGPSSGSIERIVHRAEISRFKAVIDTNDNAGRPYRLPATFVGGLSVAITNTFNSVEGSALFSPSAATNSISYPNLFYVPLTVSRGGDFPVELMLANGQAFSAVCGAFNAIVIREDGT